MRIWVDADACPAVIKEILFRAAVRTKIDTTFVANQLITTTRSPFIKSIQVLPGFDVADNYILQNMEVGDLVVTADIPLADAVLSQKGMALNPRGELYSASNIKQRLAMRNFSEQLRSSGVKTGGPLKLSKKEIQDFANCLDRLLSNHRAE